MTDETILDITNNTVRGDVINARLVTDSADSAVSWAAIFAGALAATSLSLILLVLGSGLGLAVVSPWANDGVSATTFAVSTVIWMIIMQWVSSGMGGYLTGRLRTRWLDVDSDETFFRDTAHGFFVWALSTIVTAGLLTSAISSAISGGAKAVSTVAGGVAAGAVYSAAEEPIKENATGNPGGVNAYVVDSLFRSLSMNTAPPVPSAAPTAAPSPSTTESLDPASPEPAPVVPYTYMTRLDAKSPMSNPVSDARARAQAVTILVHGAGTGDYPEEDKAYLAELVSSETGISKDEATQRVNNTITEIEATKIEARVQADNARKVASSTSLFAFLSFLVGAFIACVSAALGGQHREKY